MSKGYNVSALADYVAQNQDIMKKEMILGEVKGDTIKNMAKQLGVKGTERLNYLNVDAVLQNASCGFNPSGSTVFTERDLVTKPIKAEDEFCELDLLNKWTEHQVRVAADQDAMTFEAEVMDGILSSVDTKLEKMVWTGNTASGSMFNGLLTIAEGADSASTITGTSSGSVYQACVDAYMLLPEELLDNESTRIFISPANFRALRQELVAMNIAGGSPYYAPDNEEVSEITLPGSDIKIHKTMGLAGVNNKIYATSYSNMCYGADLVNGNEIVDAWYSKDNGTFRYRILFNAGVNTYFPDFVVVITKQ